MAEPNTIPSSATACDTEVQAETGFRSPLPLSDEADLIQRFRQDVALAGLVGEEKNASVVFLVAVSAELPKPLHVSVGGSSSAGKNQLTGTVASLLPEENKKMLTGMTPKVLMHSGEDEYQHKAVFIAEYEGAAGADYAIRTMQSEQIIEWEYVETSSRGIEKKKNQVRGPAAFIQATTRVTLHPENETRLLFLQMDESEEQTRAINQRQAAEAEGKITVCPSNLRENWHAFLRSLEPTPVRIPYASQLAASIPSDRVRSRRDFPKLLGLIEASAFLHQHQRGRNAGYIFAAPLDYVIARELFVHSYYAGPESRVGELVRAACQLSKGEFTVVDLLLQTGWRKSKTYEVLGRAEELGCIVRAEQTGRYRLSTKELDAPLKLPEKIKLSAEDFRISTKRDTEVFPEFHERWVKLHPES